MYTRSRAHIDDIICRQNSILIMLDDTAKPEKLAEMVDGNAEYVEKPGEIRPALERALAADKLAVVHIRVDPKSRRLGGSNYLQ